jgi:hypothetical protein
VAFTVNVPPPPPPPCNVVWLPPLSLGKVQQGGFTVPIKFQLQCSCSSDNKKNKNDDSEDVEGEATKDISVTIAISEVLANGSFSTAQLFSYGKNPNPPTYAIEDGNTYHLNFPTARGVHRYHIEIYRFPSGSTTPQLLGTKEFTTH